jgi:hypothetical protein
VLTSEDALMLCAFEGDGVLLEDSLLGVMVCISLTTLKMFISAAEGRGLDEHSTASLRHRRVGVRDMACC